MTIFTVLARLPMDPSGPDPPNRTLTGKKTAALTKFQKYQENHSALPGSMDE